MPRQPLGNSSTPIVADNAEASWHGVAGAPSGLPETRPPGMPPALSGPPGFPKDLRFPKVPKRSQLVTVNPGNDLVGYADGFPVRSIYVDNYAPQWLWHQASLCFIPPFTLGKIIHAPSASESLTLRWMAPPAISQPASDGLSYAVAWFTEDDWSPSPGASYSPDIAPPTGDGAALPGDTGNTVAFAYAWNGSGWDRIRTGDGIGYALQSGTWAGGTSVAIMPAVAGKRARILSLSWSSSIGANVISLQDGIGGSVRAYGAGTANAQNFMAMSEAGILMSVGNAAAVQVVSTGAVTVTITGQYE